MKAAKTCCPDSKALLKVSHKLAIKATNTIQNGRLALTLMPSMRCLRDVPTSFGPEPPKKSLVLITKLERFKLSFCIHSQSRSGSAKQIVPEQGNESRHMLCCSLTMAICKFS